MDKIFTVISAPENVGFPLRKIPFVIRDFDLKSAIKKYNFFEIDWNNKGYFKNELKDNGDETITDNATKLMWEKSGKFLSFACGDENKHIENMNASKFAGYSNWRLPTIIELSSLITKDKNNNLHISSLFDEEITSCGSCDKTIQNGKLIWCVNYWDGNIGISIYDLGNGVKAVRSLN